MYEKISLKKPPKIDQAKAVNLLLNNYSAAVETFFDEVSNQKYLYWDKAKYYLANTNLTPSEAWHVVRQIRQFSSVNTPIKTESGESFTWYRPKYTDKFLHEIDMHTGGAFLTEKNLPIQESERQKYLTRGIVEESIASSQLEGADTANKYAKKMLTENIKPRTKSEQMIVNNYRVMQKIENEYKNQELSVFLMQTLQSELTAGTLDAAYNAGEFRKDSDGIVVMYDEKIAHTPPSAAFVKAEIERLIKYANDDSDFVHPILKAIQLHFWIGFLHPFPDGNGRLARAVFYWYLFKHDYWAIGYLPISMVLKRSQHDYAYSYIYSEQDNCDFTYFFDYNIRCILKAIEHFNLHVERQISENRQLVTKIETRVPGLNARQISALKFLLNGANASTSKNSYGVMNGVSLKTAYRDLKMLNELGLIEVNSPVGRATSYVATKKAREMLEGK